MINIEMGTPMGSVPQSPGSMGMPGMPGAGGVPSTGAAPQGSAPNDRPLSAGGQVPTGSSAIVSEVLRTLRQSEAFGVEDEAEAATAQIETGEAPMEPEVLPELLKFVEQNPLRGTIVGESFSVALIGKMRVRLGEIVPGTGAVLTKVERGRATLDDGGLIVELELRPLETSAALMHEREATRARAATGADGLGSFPDGANGLPGAESAAAGSTPGPRSSGNQNTNNDPSGSQGDF